jgi:D-alanyl-D-alanine-carboxypeptidase/D-alanyl-D-alanine-endopeptidase
MADMMVFARAVAAGRQGPLGAAAERLVTPLAAYEGHEIGYAVFLQGTAQRRIVSHSGLTGGFRTLWMVLPQGEALVASVSNSQAPSQMTLHAVYRSLFPVPSAPQQPDVAELPRYEGVYRYGREGVFAFRIHGGVLYMRSGQDGFARLVPVGGGRFTRPESAADFEFRQEAGRVVGVTLRQAGRVVNARRDESAGAGYAMVAREQLQPFAGRYRMPWGAVMDVTAADGQLLARLPRQWRLPVFAVPSAPDRFAYTAVRAELQFERDAQGRVAALVLHQNGEHRAPRLPDEMR